MEWEGKIHELTQKMGIGAQFGGKYFCHDVRVIRLPRHGASCPVGIGVSCSADRQAKAKITKVGRYDTWYTYVGIPPSPSHIPNTNCMNATQQQHKGWCVFRTVRD